MIELVQWQVVPRELQHAFKSHVYTHCAAHRLNLYIVKCCSIREISNMMDVADSIVKFFNIHQNVSSILRSALMQNLTLLVPQKMQKVMSEKMG